MNIKLGHVIYKIKSLIREVKKLDSGDLFHSRHFELLITKEAKVKLMLLVMAQFPLCISKL